MIPKVAIDMLIELWPMLTLFTVVMITLRLMYLKVNHEKFVLYKELMSLCFILYILLLFELVTSTDFESYSNNFIPFKEMFRYNFSSKLFFRNVLGNIILFIPFGYFVSYYCKLNRVYQNFIITLITSLTIEIIQANIGRSFDIDDIILNLVGGFIGYGLYYYFKKLLKKFPEKFKNNLLLNFICIIIIIVLCLIILSLYGVVI
jgi:glycopeptide antibiotics resistance protein